MLMYVCMYAYIVHYRIALVVIVPLSLPRPLGLRHRQCRNMTVAVLCNMAKLSTAMSVLAETAGNYFKLSKSGEVQGKCMA